MLKGKVLKRFRGENYHTIYEEDKTYDFEEARAKNLASRSLIQIVSEVVEQPLKQNAQEEETEKIENAGQDAQEESLKDIFAPEQEHKTRGRQRKTE